MQRTIAEEEQRKVMEDAQRKLMMDAMKEHRKQMVDTMIAYT